MRSLRVLTALALLLLIAACAADYQHVFVTPRGPGSITITHAQGNTFCRVFEDDNIEHCRHYANAKTNEVIRITATPDEGHEFLGWSPRHPTSWNSDLDTNTNPLELKVDSNYLFYANFR
jgi:hypothetical protein